MGSHTDGHEVTVACEVARYAGLPAGSPGRERYALGVSRSRVLRVALAASAAALAVSGCGAGFHPYTSTSMKPRDGANYPDVGDSSPLAIRHAFVLGPAPDDDPFAKNSDAAIYLSVINQRAKSDELVSASSPDADKVVLAADGEEGGIAVPAPTAGRPEADPVQLGQPPYSENTVTLTGLTRELRSGSTVRVTFEFQRAGDITMALPVVPHTAHRETLSPAPNESATPSETPADDDTGTPTSTATEDSPESHG
ncbi:MAG: copper chaperone PCu(A)C [Streptosporangiales bacterium]|nr:copper chaperone PCu(A)C [Streptosporangiales bacterium]